MQQNLALITTERFGEDHQLFRLSFLSDSLLQIIAKSMCYGHFQHYWWIL